MSHSRAKGIPILIASTLKPILDIRAYEKLALSLGETNKYNLNIIGFSSKKPKSTSQIRFFSSMRDYHSRLDRGLAQFRFLKALFQVKPKVVICCTYEYLFLASLFKKVLGYYLIYDVQENYIANLDLNPTLSRKQRENFEILIRKAEAVKGIDLYLLAEKCYQIEMPEKAPFLILENKFQGEIKRVSPKSFKGRSKFKFIITGTLTPAFGILEAIHWFQKICESYPESELLLIGQVPLLSFKKELESHSQNLPGLILKIEDEPIPHQEILGELEKADFALAPYHLESSIKDKFPTKLFECAALGVPILLTPNPIWEEFLSPYQGGHSIDFSNLDFAINSFQEALSIQYFSSPVPDTIQWKKEKLHLQEAIQNLLS